jgi:hypothetical protein
VKQVQVGTTEGNQVTITSGLNDGDLVVTDGQDKLQPGAEVTVQAATASGAAAAPANASNGEDGQGSPTGQPGVNGSVSGGRRGRGGNRNGNAQTPQ